MLLLLYSLLIGCDLDWKKTASFPRRLGKGNDYKEHPDIIYIIYIHTYIYIYDDDDDDGDGDDDDVSMAFGQRMQTFWRTSSRQLVHDGEENARQWAGG